MLNWGSPYAEDESNLFLFLDRVLHFIHYPFDIEIQKGSL